MNVPDFIVIGAQKSGTTTLFSLLKSISGLYLPPQKEVQFFSNDDLYARGVDWYWSENFAVEGFSGLRGEVSPQYMMHAKVPFRIKSHMPDVRLIAILRHPLYRAYSHYLMEVRRGSESRTFEEAFADSLVLSSSGTALSESESLFRFSEYSEILGRYLDDFPKENMLLLFQEDP